ncbi:hypothetical protein M0R45_009993 [Rubus argutus]|uniref:AAA+ ATPase domain-containing protein n=1 Tax=Rubus argutus TaxID=59490 RepID=A0AAW1Y5N0_RUBAR
MEVVIAVVGKVAEYSVAPVVRQFGYLIHYESNVAHLTNQVETLTAMRDGVILKIDAATRNSETILPEVENWLNRVNRTLLDKETCFEKETTAKAECCSNGWFPNLKIRHSLSRKAKKMSPDVDSLLDKKFESVACSGPPPQLGFQPIQHEGASASGTSNNVNFESRKSTVRDVMETLKGNQFNPIVICGMGGVGKTTLVGEVVNKAKIEGLFDEYAKAIVNEKPDPSKIQRDVAEYLGLKLEEEGLESRADKLRERLSGTKRALIVLDNVWETLNLWEIGIPSGPKSCKVLVTSRNQDVFNEEETRKIFHIGVLPESDAWSLFKKVAGGDIESDPELRPIAEQVLSKCDGLPVAISTLGSALRQKETKPIWKNALGLLQKPFGGDIRGMKKNVYQTIRLMSLPVRLRNIQTLCLKGLELELQTISVIGELRTLMILRLSGSTIKHVPEEFKNLCNLKLLDLGNCRGLEEISPGIISSLSKLEELYLLGSFKKWDDDGMLSVSELLDLPLLTRLETDLPPVVDILRNNMLLFDKLKRFKLIIRRKSTASIRENILHSAETFIFRSVSKLFENPGDNYLNLDADLLVAVTVLLKKTHFLELKGNNSSNDVSELHLLDPETWTYLQEEIRNNQLSPCSFCELRLLRVQCCDKISNLVPTYMQARLQKLEMIKVSYCSSLQEIFELRRSRVNEDEGSRQTPSNISQPDQGIMQIRNQTDFKVFQHLTHLFVSDCDSLRNVCSSSIAKSLVNLKELEIMNSRNMEEIVAAEEGEEAEDNNMFPHLRSLLLGNLPNLVSFSRDKYALDWPSMESIWIWDCPKMKNFSSGSLITPMRMKTDIGSGVDENIQKELEMSKKEKPDMNF